MARPSQNIDRLLLAAGRAVLLESGASGLKVRRVAARAGVNLGMFHYHFRSREEFIRRILQEIYEEFFRNMVGEVSARGTPLERLRRALLALGAFSRDNRALLLIMIHDLMGGYRHGIRFAKANFSRHLTIIRGLIRRCRREGLIRKIPEPAALSFLMGSIGLPSILIAILERADRVERLPFSVQEFQGVVLSEKGLALRVEMALKGLSTGGGRGLR